MVEIPVLTAQGTGAAPMTIERDGDDRGASEIKPQWRASFSIDLESIGPVHVQIALNGERASVTLKAERAHSAELCRRDCRSSDAGLRQAEIEARRPALPSRKSRPKFRRRAAAWLKTATPSTFLDQAS